MRVSTDDEDTVLAEVLPDLQADDVVTIHEPDCAIEAGKACDCERIVVRGPSGKA